MKLTTQGTSALIALSNADLPEQTATYTPLAHMMLLANVRFHIVSNGFSVMEEHYFSAVAGQVGMVVFTIDDTRDDDLSLVVAFSNSYNKQNAFRLAIGAKNKFMGGTMFIGNKDVETFRRVHTGKAEEIAKGAISDMMGKINQYWNVLHQSKELMKSITLTTDQRDQIIGQLFLSDSALTSIQMTAFKDEIRKTAVWGNTPLNAWTLFSQLTYIMRDAHPAKSLANHEAVHQRFEDVCMEVIRSGNSQPSVIDGRQDAIEETAQLQLNL